MLITRVDRWSLTYCRCLGIKIYSQKSGVKSELVVERSLKLDALNLNWLGVIDGPPLHGQFRKEYLKSCTPKMKKKNCEPRGAFLAYWRLISLLSFEKELGWGERLVQHTIFGS